MSKKDLLVDQQYSSPFGTNVCVPVGSLARIHRTSGTTDRPLLLTFTSADIKNVIDVGARAFKTAGVEPGDIVFNCMNYCMWMGGFTDHQSLETAGATVVPYGVGNTENLIRLLLEIKGASIHATPSYLAIIKKVLAEKFHMQPKDLHLKKGFFGGESGLQDAAFRNTIEEEWGILAINANYGLSDVVSILGAECPFRSGLHFTAEKLLHIELIDDKKQPLPLVPGVKGELVVTTIAKESQPLIRYMTGDVITILSMDSCPCGEASFRFAVSGRTDDMITVKGINFHPESLRSIISEYKELTGNYIIRISDSATVDGMTIVVETGGFLVNSDMKNRLAYEIRKKFFIKPDIELIPYFPITGNKIPLIQRIKNAEIEKE